MIGGSVAFARSRASADVLGSDSAAAAPDTALLQRMLDAEDGRVTDPVSLAPLVEGSRSSDAETRRIAARAIGRMERRENLQLLEALVTDPSAAVRAEALNAAGQIAKADGAPAPGGGDARPRVWTDVQALIRRLMTSESDPAV